MPNKKMKFDNRLLFLIIAVIILSVLIFKNPAITGQAILGKETIYSDDLSLKINESGTYEWQVKNAGNIKSLKATGSVTSNGTARVYIENNGTRQLVFDSSKQLFDVDIRVLPEYKKVMQGDKILIQNVLFNLRGFGAGNVNVRYSVKDSKGNVVAVEEESVYIETQAKFIRELIIPPEMKSGTYTAFVEAFTNSTFLGTGSDTFEVRGEKEPFYQQLKFYIATMAAIVALAIAMLFGVREYQLLRKRKDIEEIKAKEPEEKVRKMEGELKALEEAYKSGFISEETYAKEKKRIEERLEALRKGEGST